MTDDLNADALFGPAPVAPTMPPAIPQAPGLSSFLPKPNLADKIAPIAAIAASLLLGAKKGGAGLATGFAQGQQREQQNQWQHASLLEADAQRQQAMAQQQADRQFQFQRQQQQMEQQNEARRMAALQAVKTRVAAIKDPKQYDQEIDSYAQLFQQAGFRGMTPNQLRVVAPFVAPSAKVIASDAVGAWLKNPANVALMKKDPTAVSKVTLRIDTNGDGIAENVPLLRAGELGGVQFATDDQGNFIGAVESDQKIGTPFQETLKDKRARFLAVNRRKPEADEDEALVNEAAKKVADAQRKPEAQTPTGLPASTQRRVDVATRAFDSLPAVKSTQKMSEAVGFAQSLDPNTKNPADDQALIYAFAKAMDPDSVVREGEYATVQKYAQSWAQTFGFNTARMFSNTAFLTPQARANMKQTIMAKFSAAKRQYDAIRNSYGERINRITGQGDGADYLTDYGAAFPAEAAKQTGSPDDAVMAARRAGKKP